ncbi:MAG: exonuclease subunit SbcC [Microcoleus sp. PH2017_40_RAT_O_B]|uniref:exonuclease subunit SbcC n=1 Tax=unclassified Microcoleus TaxID=2642155 RepID=UPI001D3EB3C5|nr:MULTISPECIES: exonuclease subunit SbcC [unclassified Microcoleus]MCC3574120.1 exonuclease subunit SbcC [Microcoleus sp. PH2017_34_RAT_O_A]MCC3611623.1 exonuclease subunit SbcC [Microcoleus sp. PH2017_40_RAT_O_B]
MIPIQLTLKNFLSYREAALDFRGLHTACICGPNGAGKSSLLEAIAWSLWGSCRSDTEDDIIHIGEIDVRVDFTFSTGGQIYRVIRNRRRGQSGSLEFQVSLNWAETQDGLSFRTLTDKGLRNTQQKILEHIKLDYDTFINSAYLRQGRADEFMLKKPIERKQVLANLLKLDRYDTLSEQAKEKARDFKAKVEVLKHGLQTTQEQLQQKEAIASEQIQLQQATDLLSSQQQADTAHLQQLQLQHHNRQTWQKLLAGHQQQHYNISQECRRLQQELAAAKRQQHELQALLAQENEITAGIAYFQSLQSTEETQAGKFKAHQQAQNQRQNLQEQQRQELSLLQNKIQQLQAQLDVLEQDEKDVLDVLKQQPEVDKGLAQLQAARSRLNELEQLQLQVSPLLQQQQQAQTKLDRAHAGLTARLAEINRQVQVQQQQRQPKLQQEISAIAHQIVQLENKRVYQERVREKGQERHSFLENLQAKSRDYQTRLAEIDQKLQLLRKNEAETSAGEGKAAQFGETQEANSPLIVRDSGFGACPLCDRPLDEHYWNLVVTKHHSQQQEIWNQLWVVREQLAVSEREIQVLRHEYRELEQELAPYQELRERRSHLQAQLDGLGQDETRLQSMRQDAAQIERLLRTGEYGSDDLRELQQIEQQLQQLNYSDRSHSLARSDEKRLRWAEIKQAQIKDAQQKLNKINSRRPDLQTQLAAVQQQFEQQKNSSEIQQQILSLNRYIAEVGYNLEQHEHVRSEMRKTQFWIARAEKLRSATQQFPQVQQRVNEIASSIAVRDRDLQAVTAQTSAMNQQLQEHPDPIAQISAIEQQMGRRRQQLDQHLGSLGRLQQQQQNLEALQVQLVAQKEQMQVAKRQYKVYQELGQAFGKNGIQALMIENVLPQLEAETNQILSRLSANQLHVQFITQRAAASKKATKLIDTLDILIADARGTRPYETYSGGEAFRINFAIRLALARLLSQRAGTALQMLIIDEGFGTQDAEGCDRLIAAINAIASDFACILTVTHMPHLKEAFQARIEVTKTAQGSSLALSI